MKNKKIICAGLIITILLACIFCPYNEIYGAKSKKPVKKNQKAITRHSEAKEPEISAESFAIMSISTGEMVYSKNPDRKQFISGPERLMCAISVIDNMHDKKEMNNFVTIKEEYIEKDDVFKTGDSIKVKDLLSAMLISGSRSAAFSLADYSLGSQDEFVTYMNNKAKQLELKNTNFTSPALSYDKDQYSSVSDYAVLTRIAMSDDFIKKMSGKKGYKIKTEKGNKISVKNNEELIKDAEKAKKRGYSIFAGIIDDRDNNGNINYMLSAINKDIKLVAVTSNIKKENASKEMNKLIKYGFAKVKKTVAVEKNKKAGYALIKNGERTIVPVYTKERAYVYLPPEGSKSLIEKKKVIEKNIKAPLKEGEKVGEYKIYVGDEFQGSVDLIIKKPISTGYFPSKIYISNNAIYISSGLILLIIFLRIERKRRIKRRNRKRRMRRAEKARKIARRELAKENYRKNSERYF